MLNIIKEYRHYVVTLILAVIPLIALNAGGKRPADWHWLDRAAVRISAPAQNAISWTIDTAWNSLEKYLFVIHTHDLNQELNLENRKLLSELAAFREVALENDRLKKLIEFNTAAAGRKIIARVIAQDVSQEFRVVRVNKGSIRGVEAGMAAITPEGIVGRVLRVGSDYSDVLTILDSSSAVDALVQRSRSRGIAEGLTEDAIVIKYLRRTDDIQAGDLVVSSGIGGIFPKGLTIGKVSSVKKQSFGITQTVEVAPAVDFSKLEEITLIDPPDLPLGEEHGK